MNDPREIAAMLMRQIPKDCEILTWKRALVQCLADTYYSCGKDVPKELNPMIELLKNK